MRACRKPASTPPRCQVLLEAYRAIAEPDDIYGVVLQGEALVVQRCCRKEPDASPLTDYKTAGEVLRHERHWGRALPLFDSLMEAPAPAPLRPGAAPAAGRAAPPGASEPLEDRTMCAAAGRVPGCTHPCAAGC
jgi:hypothetical protein